MIKGGTGGANTKTGLHFEGRVDLATRLRTIAGYEVRPIPEKAGEGVYFEGELVARTFKQHAFYKFLEEEGVEWKEIVSKKILPDNALLVIVRETLFIIEVKFQQVAGSVDEKLQTCDFKRKQYTKLVMPLNLRVEYVYVLGEWFKKPAYRDTLDYILSMNCHYHFGGIPLAWLGLPAGRR
jgi:hypothetical protein